jgi:hypothetical protein
MLTLTILAVAAMGLAWFLYLRPGGPPRFIDWYELADGDSLVIQTETGAGEEIRVTDVLETADSVTITVRSFTTDFGISTDIGVKVQLRVDLEQPLGDRRVFDPHHEVPAR